MRKLTQVLTQVSLCCLALVMWSMNAYGQGVNTARPLGTTSSPYGYYEYLPLDYNSNSNNYPVLVFLHGAGQVGNGSSQLSYVLKHGPPKVIQNGRDFPFIVVTPQSSTSTWNVDNVNKFIEFVKNKYRVNSNKIYMTGLSMGAMGTYNYAAKYPTQLAAMVPIAGKANTSTICNSKNIPLWHFHGSADNVINVKYAYATVDAYNKCSPPLTGKLTVYQGVDHGAWFKTYDGTAGHDIYKWMLQFTKGSTKTTETTNSAPTVSAGSDKSLTLPTNSTTLYGSASDSDGSISSTVWTKVNGPSATMSGTSTKNLGLSNLVSGTYTFRLTAKDNDGASKYDDVIVKVVSSSTSNSAPSVSAGSDKTLTLPTNSTTLYGSASDSDGSIASTTWTKVNGPSASMSGTTTKSLGLSNLVAGTYTFRLTAKDNNGASKYDDVIVKVNSSTTTSTGLAAPSNVTAKMNSNGSISLTWKDNSSNESGFEIWVRTSSTSYKQMGATGSNKTSYTVGNLSASTTYYVKMRAKNSTSYSSYSSEVSTSGGSTSTGSDSETTSSSDAPSSVTAKMNSNGSISLTWKDNSSNEQGFDIFVRTSSTSYKQVGATGSNKTSYTVGNLSASTTYYVKLRARYSTSYSAFSPEVSTAGGSTTTTTTTSDVPSSVTAKMNSNGSISLTWKDNSSNEEGFDIYVRTSSTSYKQMGATGSNKTSYTVGNLSASTTYYVKLRARYSSSYSAFSSEVSTSGGSSTTNTDNSGSSNIAAPASLTAKINTLYNSVYVKWADKSNNETNFEVFMSAGNNSSYRKVGTTGANKTHYTVSNLSNGQTYYLKVRAINKEDNSAYSNEVVVKNSSTSTLASTTSVNAAGSQKVMVNFNLGQNAGAPWNNFDQDPDTNSKLSNLLDEAGNATAISLELLTPWGYESGWNGYGDQGVVTGNNSGVVPDQVMQTYFWTSRKQAEVVKVSGLDAKTTYTFSFMGSKKGNGDRTTLFSINGTTVSLNAAANSNGIVTIKNVQPDSKGELTIKVQKAPNASFAYLNAMIIEAGAAAGNNEASLQSASNPFDEGQLGEGKKLSLTQVSAYPNPATDFVDVRFGSEFEGDVQVQLLDLSGKVILSQQVQASPEAFTRLDLTSQQLKAGMYVIRIDNGLTQKSVKVLKN